MKIKNIFALSLLCLPLCGCDVYDYDAYDNRYSENDVEISQQYQDEINAIDKLTNDRSSFEKLSKEQIKTLETEFTKVDDIRFIQHSNGRDVTIYEDNKIKGAYVLYDGYWVSSVLPYSTRLKNSQELYSKLERTAFTPYDYNVGKNGTGAIICNNREYSVMDIESQTPFSITYNDVDVEVENMPLKVLVYENNGKVDKIEIVSIATQYFDKYSDKNIADVKVLLDELGFGEESESLAREVAESLNKASYKRSDGSLEVCSYRDIISADIADYSIFTININ